MDFSYYCWKCKKGSWSQGGRPICCHCGAKMQLPNFPPRKKKSSSKG